MTKKELRYALSETLNFSQKVAECDIFLASLPRGKEKYIEDLIENISNELNIITTMINQLECYYNIEHEHS